MSGQPNGVAELVFPADPSGGPLGFGWTGGLIFVAGGVLAMLAILIGRGAGPFANLNLGSRAIGLALVVVLALAAAVLIGFGLMLAAGPSIPVLSSEYSKVAVFAVLIIVLLVKPQGIFSKYA
jgi:branched-subunit amino acid ABC-type transport system permease component